MTQAQTVSTRTPLTFASDVGARLGGSALDYMNSLFNSTNGIQNGYTGPTVAGIDPLQSQTLAQVPNAVGAWGDMFANGEQMMNAGYNTLSSMPAEMRANYQPVLGQMQQLADQARGDISSIGQYVPQALNTINNAQAAVGNANNYITSGNDYLTAAGNRTRSAGIYDPNELQRHLNPYVGGVLNEISRLGNQNLTENVLPQVNSTFAGNGQFGSTRNADFTNRAIRDNQREISGAQANALNTAYNNASTDYLNWNNADLNAANQLGNIGNNVAGLSNNVNSLANSQANLAIAGSNLNDNSAINRIGQAGAVAGQLGTGLDSMNQYYNAAGNAAQTMFNQGNSMGQYGIEGAQQNWNDLSNAWNMGASNRGINQEGLTAQQQNWQDRWQAPLNALGSLANIYGTLSSNGGTTSQVQTGQPQNTNDPYISLLDNLFGTMLAPNTNQPR